MDYYSLKICLVNFKGSLTLYDFVNTSIILSHACFLGPPEKSQLQTYVSWKSKINIVTIAILVDNEFHVANLHKGKQWVLKINGEF